MLQTRLLKYKRQRQEPSDAVKREETFAEIHVKPSFTSSNISRILKTNQLAFHFFPNPNVDILPFCWFFTLANVFWSQNFDEICLWSCQERENNSTAAFLCRHTLPHNQCDTQGQAAHANMLTNTHKEKGGEKNNKVWKQKEISNILMR